MNMNDIKELSWHLMKKANNKIILQPKRRSSLEDEDYFTMKAMRFH